LFAEDILTKLVFSSIAAALFCEGKKISQAAAIETKAVIFLYIKSPLPIQGFPIKLENKAANSYFL